MIDVMFFYNGFLKATICTDIAQNSDVIMLENSMGKNKVKEEVR